MKQKCSLIFNDEMPLAELMKKLNEINIEYGEIKSHDKKDD